ncbi:uncharacterized protein PHALS_15024 [Plasmopara halstedii]|uniref:Uncharacterized protein n=1 Tax=Plasmopara halstedii TaxID=4781 RepID=A0A0P1A9Z5_PLAHL|nr:uncharacterized protein PHALS_15024 [Plasmopara halstedii]CEG37116.1 hypothetical protein PHALS_15024 [Plasmopara halstedii]|eukprot:XP_024573485.1 hypothetical protein PHALS_15024 [Plasmopara halstedii]
MDYRCILIGWYTAVLQNFVKLFAGVERSTERYLEATLQVPALCAMFLQQYLIEIIHTVLATVKYKDETFKH